MKSNMSDKRQQLDVGTQIMYKFSVSTPRKGIIIEKLRERNKWSVQWEDGTTSSISLKPQNHDVWDLFETSETPPTQLNGVSTLEGFACGNTSGDDTENLAGQVMQEVKIEDQNSGNQRKESQEEGRKADSGHEDKNFDACDTSTDTVEGGKDERPESERM